MGVGASNLGLRFVDHGTACCRSRPAVVCTRTLAQRCRTQRQARAERPPQGRGHRRHARFDHAMIASAIAWKRTDPGPASYPQ